MVSKPIYKVYPQGRGWSVKQVVSKWLPIGLRWVGSHPSDDDCEEMGCYFSGGSWGAHTFRSTEEAERGLMQAIWRSAFQLKRGLRCTRVEASRKAYYVPPWRTIG